jgi:hypothetical protein
MEEKGHLVYCENQSLIVAQSLVFSGVHFAQSLVFSGVHVAQSLVFCLEFCRSLFGLFLLTIVFSVLRFTASDYPLVPLNFSFQYSIEKY